MGEAETRGGVDLVVGTSSARGGGDEEVDVTGGGVAFCSVSATGAEVTLIGASTSSTLGSYTVLVCVWVLPSGLFVVMTCW